jgi:ComF family protein
MDKAGAQSNFRIKTLVQQSWRALIDFVVPPKCLVRRDAIVDPASLCLSCWTKLKHIDAPVCNVLGTPFAYDQGKDAVSAAALAAPPDWDRARAAVAYDEASRGLVHALKYRDTMEAGLLMARMMGRAGHELLEQADIIIPVPLHRWRLWNRRFNQAAFLAKQLARRDSKPLLTDVLVRTKASRSQVGLKHEERRRNVAKVFAVVPEAVSHIAGRKVLLVDDVLTTGATAASCAATLKKQGLPKLMC